MAVRKGLAATGVGVVVILGAGFYLKDPVRCIYNPRHERDLSGPCAVTAQRVLLPARFRIDALLSQAPSGDLAATTAAAKKALALDPNNEAAKNAYDDVLVEEALDLLIEDQPDQALKKLSDVLARQPEHNGAQLLRAIAYSDKKQFDAALADENQLLERNPSNIFVLYYRAVTAARAGNFAQSAADYSELYRVNPEDTAAIAGHANAMRRMKDFDKAVASLDVLLPLTPRDEYVYVQKANVLVEQDKAELALGFISAAEATLERKILKLEKLKAYALYRLKLNAYALKALDAAAALDPADSWVQRMRDAIKANKSAEIEAALAELDDSAELDEQRGAEARNDLLNQIKGR